MTLTIMPVVTIMHDIMSHDTYHHAGGDGDPPAAVGVRHDVAVAHAEEGDGDEPHRVEEVGVLLVMVPAVIQLN